MLNPSNEINSNFTPPQNATKSCILMWIRMCVWQINWNIFYCNAKFWICFQFDLTEFSSDFPPCSYIILFYALVNRTSTHLSQFSAEKVDIRWNFPSPTIIFFSEKSTITWIILWTEFENCCGILIHSNFPLFELVFPRIFITSVFFL